MRKSLQWLTRSRLFPRRGVTGSVVSVVMGLITVTTLVGAFLAWRMAQEPVSLRFAIPMIERALSAEDTALQVRIGDFRLRREGLAFVFEAVDLTVHRTAESGRTAPPLAVLPVAEINLSLPALLQDGVLAAESVVADRLTVSLRRNADGVKFAITGDSEQPAGGIELAALRRLLQTDTRLRHLKSVQLNDLTFRIVDPLLGVSWQTEGTRMTLLNEPSGFKWEGAVSVAEHSGPWRSVREGGSAQWSLTYPPLLEDAAGDPAGRADAPALLTVRIDRLQPAVLGELIPGFDEAVQWEGAVSGALSTQFAPHAVPDEIRFSLRSEAGSVALPKTGGPLAFTAVHAVGRFGLREQRLDLDDVTIRYPDGVAELKGSAALLDDGETLRFTASATGVRPAWLSAAVPDADMLQGVDLAVATDIAGTVRLDGRIVQASVGATVAPGTIALPGVLPEPLPLRSATLRLRVADGGQSFALENLQLRLPRQSGEGDIEVTATGNARRNGEGRLDIAVSPMDVADLKRLWPIGVGEGGRVWIVDQVQQGTMEGAEAAITFRLPGTPGVPVPQDVRVDARMPLRDVALIYWPPLPLAEGIDANARLTEKLFEADVLSGTSGGMRIAGGKVEFSGIDKGKGYEHTDLSFDIEGPVADLMAILDRPPLGFARYLDMTPETLGGTIAGTLTADFPPIADLDLDDIEIGAKGGTAGLRLPQAAFGQDLTDGRIAFDVDKTALKLDGKAALVGTPVALQGEVRFPAVSPFRSRFQLQATLDDATRRTLGFASFPFSPEIVSGPVAVDMTAKEGTDGNTDIEVNADLTAARLGLPLLDWTSPAGEYAALNAQVRLSQGQLRQVDAFRLTAPQLSLAGDAEWPASGDAAPTVRISEFRLGAGTSLTMVGQPAPDGAYRLSIAGQRLDARPLFESLAKSDDPQADAQKPPPADDPEGERLAVDMTVESVQLGSGPPARDLRGSVTLHDGQPQTAAVKAATENGAPVTVNLAADGTATLRASDAGAFLAAMGITERVERGGLQVDATVATADDGIDGTVLLQNAYFREAPFLMRLLSGVAIDPPAVDGSWSVDRLESEFALNQGVLTLNSGRVSGGELGATFEGWIDLNQDMLDVSGAIVPAYSVNRVLRAIPLIGDVLTGGEGLFAANYRARGNLDEPEISINPLTVLAPGLLRRLFGNRASAPPNEEQEAAPQKPEDSQDLYTSPDEAR